MKDLDNFPAATDESHTHKRHAAGTNLPEPIAASPSHVVHGSGTPLADSQCSSDAQEAAAVGTSSAPAPATPATTPRTFAPGRDADHLLYFFADQLDDLERIRIAAENRLRTLTSDGEWGKGLPPESRQAQTVAKNVADLVALEHQATLQLKRAVRDHYMGEWVKQTIGVGEKQAGRLLAAIGNPWWNHTAGAPRTVSQLWAFCGLHVWSNPGHEGAATHERDAGVAPYRTRGVKANWSTDARTRTYLVAESCIKQRRSPYRAVYDDGRTKYDDATHQVECKRCGPKGKPAQPGSPLSAGHQHGRAMRLVMKALLKDMWRHANPNISPESIVREAA